MENKTAGNFYSGVFAKPEGNRAYVGTFEVASLDRGGSGEVNILRKSDKEVVHRWKYAYQGEWGENGEDIEGVITKLTNFELFCRKIRSLGGQEAEYISMCVLHVDKRSGVVRRGVWKSKCVQVEEAFYGGGSEIGQF